jgi:hypothetical protein
VLDLDPLIVPHFHDRVTRAGCNKTKMVCVSTCNDLFAVRVGSATKYFFPGLFNLTCVIAMNFDRLVPSYRDYSAVVSTVADERNFAILMLLLFWILLLLLKLIGLAKLIPFGILILTVLVSVRLQGVSHDSTEDVENLEVSE